MNRMTNRRVAGLLALSALSVGPLVACADNGPADTGQTSPSPGPTTALTSPRGVKTPLPTTEEPGDEQRRRNRGRHRRVAGWFRLSG